MTSLLCVGFQRCQCILADYGPVRVPCMALTPVSLLMALLVPSRHGLSLQYWQFSMTCHTYSKLTTECQTIVGTRECYVPPPHPLPRPKSASLPGTPLRGRGTSTGGHHPSGPLDRGPRPMALPWIQNTLIMHHMSSIN